MSNSLSKQFGNSVPGASIRDWDPVVSVNRLNKIEEEAYANTKKQKRNGKAIWFKVVDT